MSSTLTNNLMHARLAVAHAKVPPLPAILPPGRFDSSAMAELVALGRRGARVGVPASHALLRQPATL